MKYIKKTFYVKQTILMSKRENSTYFVTVTTPTTRNTKTRIVAVIRAIVAARDKPAVRNHIKSH